jgi:hypothetical protein
MALNARLRQLQSTRGTNNCVTIQEIDQTWAEVKDNNRRYNPGFIKSGKLSRVREMQKG